MFISYAAFLRNFTGFKRLSVGGFFGKIADLTLVCLFMKASKKLCIYDDLGVDAALHCKKISIYVFPEKELRGLSPNFHIHVSVCLFWEYLLQILGIVSLQCGTTNLDKVKSPS